LSIPLAIAMVLTQALIELIGPRITSDPGLRPGTPPAGVQWSLGLEKFPNSPRDRTGLSMIYGFVRQSGSQVNIDSEPGMRKRVRAYSFGTQSSIDAGFVTDLTAVVPDQGNDWVHA
jgi:hypothetical protein